MSVGESQLFAFAEPRGCTSAPSSLDRQVSRTLRTSKARQPNVGKAKCLRRPSGSSRSGAASLRAAAGSRRQTARGRLPTDAMLHPLTAFRSVTVPQARELASPAECPLTVDRPQSRSASGKSRPRLLMVVSRHRVYSKEVLRHLEASTSGK